MFGTVISTATELLMPCTAVPEQLCDEGLVIIIVLCGPLVHQRACEQCIQTGVAMGKLFDVACGYNQVLRKKHCGVADV